MRWSSAVVVVLACLTRPSPGRAETPETPVPGVPAPQAESVSDAPAPPTTDVTRPPERLHADVEYLLWWLREGRVPPLLTTGTPASGGILGRTDTKVIYGDGRLETRHGDRFNGIRLGAGYWFGDGPAVGIEAGAFFLERDSTHFKAVSDSGGNPVLTRPYVNALDGSSAGEVVAAPGPNGQSGGLVGYSRVELFGQEANFVLPCAAGESCRLELLAGAHFLQLRDRTDLTSSGRPLDSPATLLGLSDHLRVEDRFYGGQFGLRGGWSGGRWDVNATAEVALGATDATLRDFGERVYQTPAERLTGVYGLAVGPANAGRSSHAGFDVVTQGTVYVGYRLSGRARVFGGYTFLYWARPLRSGDQIDLVVNPALTPDSARGPLRPGTPYRTDGFWAQGLNAGLELTW